MPCVPLDASRWERVYLAHPVLTDSYWSHRPVGVGIQDALKDLLAERIRGLRLEVRTPVGAADAATDTGVFEMARWETWKQGMGQLLAYALHLENRRRILFLFGRQRRPAALDHIRWNARHYNVHVAYLRCDQTFGPQRVCNWPARQPAPVVRTCGPGKACVVQMMEDVMSPRPSSPAGSKDTFEVTPIDLEGLNVS